MQFLQKASKGTFAHIFIINVKTSHNEGQMNKAVFLYSRMWNPLHSFAPVNRLSVKKQIMTSMNMHERFEQSKKEEVQNLYRS